MRVYFTLPSNGNAVNDYIGYYSGENATAANWPALEVISALYPPAAPAGLSAVPGDAQVVLNWPASSSASSYNVKRATASTGPFTLLASTSNITYADAAVTNGTNYYYVVSALNAAGESTDSWAVGARPVALTPPILAATWAGNELDLSWPQDHTGWRLEAQTNAVDAGLGTNWCDIPAAVFTNRIAFPLGPTNGCVLFRLLNP